MLRIEHPLKRRVAQALDLGLSLVAGPWGRLSGLRARSRTAVESPRTVLLVRLDHIGDYVMTLPAIALLRRTWPEARLVALVGSWCADLARLTPALDEVIVHDVPWWLRARGRRAHRLRWWRELRRLVRDLRDRDIDLAIDFRGDLRQILWFLWGTRSRSRAACTRSGGAALLTHPVDCDTERHVLDQALDVLRALGLTGPPPEGPHLREDPASAQWVERRLAVGLGARASLPSVLMQPGARVALRAWPAPRYAELVDHLWDRHGLPAVLVGDASDAARCAEVARRARASPLDLCGQTPLPALVSLARRSRLFVGNDSGLMHVAAACGTPVVALFGPNHPRRCGPRGVAHRVARRDFPCSPCLQIACPFTQKAEGQCMQDLSVEEVLAATEELLRETAR